MFADDGPITVVVGGHLKIAFAVDFCNRALADIHFSHWNVVWTNWLEDQLAARHGFPIIQAHSAGVGNVKTPVSAAPGKKDTQENASDAADQNCRSLVSHNFNSSEMVVFPQHGRDITCLSQ
jgi:hypothetical protein